MLEIRNPKNGKLYLDTTHKYMVEERSGREVLYRALIAQDGTGIARPATLVAQFEKTGNCAAYHAVWANKTNPFA